MEAYTEVYNFWFNELSFEDWFKKSSELDETIRSRFERLLQKSIAGELSDWRDTAKGALSEIILLDQFSRNIYRDTKEAFAQDSLALCLSQEAIRKNQHQELSAQEKSFLYMPFMHSESKKIHEKALSLFSEKGLENNYDFELKHKVIIDKFGRYPHRNEVLGRTSTKEEIEFLKSPDSSFNFFRYKKSPSFDGPSFV